MTRGIPTGLCHATAVALEDRGLLITGAAGSGKSGLALHLLSLGCVLVADDQVMLRDTGGGIVATAPDELAGKIEARHVGILKADHQTNVPLHAVVDMNQPEADRLPPQRRITIGTREFDLIHGKNVPNLAPALIALLRGRRLH